MRVVYLVGLNHKIQHRIAMTEQKAEKTREFGEYLRTCIQEHGINLLAEEFTEDLLDGLGSPTQELAGELGIRHVFCDPGPDERKELGMSSDDERETFWIERVCRAANPFENPRILFLVGAAHLESVQGKLRAAGYDVTNLGGAWGDDIRLPSPFDQT